MSLIDPTSKIFYHLDMLQHFLRYYDLRVDSVFPISVEMDLSDGCNLKCSWCRFASVHKTTLMSAELAKKILMELADVGVKSVVYSGGGEPLLNMKFGEIAEYGSSLGLDQGIYTNGVNIDKFLDVLSSEMKYVYISVDAATSKTYEEIKGCDLFEQVLQNCSALIKMKRKSKVGLGFLVSPENIDDLLLFWRMSKGLNPDYIQYRPAVTDNPSKSCLLEAMQWLETIQNEKTIVAWYKFRDLAENNGERTYTQCYGHNFLGGISADGTVWVCLNHRYHEGFDIGNLQQQSFREIWRGEKRKEAIRRINVATCPKLCRPHELNKILSQLTKGNPHKNFL